MALEDVQPGRAVERTLSASSWNLHNAAARKVLSGGQRPAQGHCSGTGIQPRNGNIVKVKNSSGSDQPQFAVLGISGMLHTPESDVDSEVMVQFRQQPWLNGVEPVLADHFGKFVVLLDGIKSDEIGRAAVCGVTVCKINMNSEAHEFADVRDADATTLDSAPSGTAKILSVDAGTGEKWGIVEIGAPAPPALMVIKEVFDNYLRCRLLTIGGEDTIDVNVAKPKQFQGFADNYIVDDEIWVMRGGYTGLDEPGGDPISFFHMGSAAALPPPTARYQTLVATGDPLVWTPDWPRAHF